MLLKTDIEIKPKEYPGIPEDVLVEDAKKQVMREFGEKHLIGLVEFFRDASKDNTEEQWAHQEWAQRGKFYRADFHVLKHEQALRILGIARQYGCFEYIKEILDEDIPELNIPKP